ncbi:MAG: aminotransferase class I/II-fold pyridoxal phosphate-dependent enzyme [Pirellulaceae bacterium]
MTDNPFDLPRDEMRALGYRVVDMIVDHFETVDEKRPVTRATRQEMDWLLQEPIPELPTPAMEVLDHVEKNIFENSAHLDHAKFYSFVPSPNNIVSTLTDALATGFNLFSGAWVSSPGAAELEMLTTNWLLRLFGFPVVEGGGLFVSGGSMANLTAMVTARQNILGDDFSKGIVYWSDQTHSSVERAARVIGLRKEQIRIIETDDDFQIRVDSLKAAVEADAADGKRPFMIVANGGTTNTAAVDPLYTLSTLCRHHNMWFHVDAAYGGAAILSAKGKARLSGIELADSVTIDPHKWFHQPYEIGCLLVRDNKKLSGTFRTQPVYLRDLAGAAEEVNFYDLGIQLTRRFRAFKFYMSMKTYGIGAFRKSVESSIELAEHLQQHLESRPNWEVITTASLAVINFRYNPYLDDKPQPNAVSMDRALDQLNQHLSDRIIADGKAMLATTIVNHQTVLRMCLINPRTTIEDLMSTIEQLEEYAEVDEMSLP